MLFVCLRWCVLSAHVIVHVITQHKSKAARVVLSTLSTHWMPHMHGDWVSTLTICTFLFLAFFEIRLSHGTGGRISNDTTRTFLAVFSTIRCVSWMQVVGCPMTHPNTNGVADQFPLSCICSHTPRAYTLGWAHACHYPPRTVHEISE